MHKLLWGNLFEKEPVFPEGFPEEWRKDMEDELLHDVSEQTALKHLQKQHDEALARELAARADREAAAYQMHRIHMERKMRLGGRIKNEGNKT